MAAVDPRTPCIIGAAQFVSRPEEGPAPEPLEQWTWVVRGAAADAAASHDVLERIDAVRIVYCQSWQYDDPVGRLCERLGFDPRFREYAGIGGTRPQQLINDAAAAILRGESDVAVVTGAEALDTKRRLKKQGERPAWSFRDASPPPFPFEAPFHPAEIAHEVFQAWLTFPLFDVGRRAALGVAPDEYRRQIGELLAPMTAVAAANPFAWFPVERSAAELMTPSPDNRLVGYPYTKLSVSVMDVDMAAAVILASHEAADALGVPPHQRVYLRGWCYAEDPHYVAEHESFATSPAMRAAGAEALRMAGVGVDEIAHFDLYSCFASSVFYGLDALGLAPGDPRGVTVTGGLPFAGGAGSNYMTHAVAAMAGILREDPGSVGLVSGVGMHMTKHVYAAYSTDPGAVAIPDEAAVQARVRAEHPPKTIVESATGTARVATYSVAHARDGSAEWGLVVADLPSGERAYARVFEPDLLAEMESAECVGAEVELVPGEQGNVVKALAHEIQA
ncbi:MAG TPA: acetyl-CoA acetyltransferase [Acidimicrobiia bacterium]|nr:acetyl-CoA acetyltransferase [Acidimicrobiia bacterium]